MTRSAASAPSNIQGRPHRFIGGVLQGARSPTWGPLPWTMARSRGFRQFRQSDSRPRRICTLIRRSSLRPGAGGRCCRRGMATSMALNFRWWRPAPPFDGVRGFPPDRRQIEAPDSTLRRSLPFPATPNFFALMSRATSVFVGNKSRQAVHELGLGLPVTPSTWRSLW